MARFAEKHPGKDGIVQSVTVKTAKILLNGLSIDKTITKDSTSRKLQTSFYSLRINKKKWTTRSGLLSQ